MQVCQTACLPEQAVETACTLSLRYRVGPIDIVHGPRLRLWDGISVLQLHILRDRQANSFMRSASVRLARLRLARPHATGCEAMRDILVVALDLGLGSSIRFPSHGDC